MRLGKTLDARTSGTIMADRDLEDDLQSFFKNNPLETRLIGGSLLAYFVVFEPLFQWMWDDGTRCGVWGDDYSCMGSVWLTLAYVAILCLVMAPAIWGAFSMFTKYFTRVNDQQRGDVVWLATLGIPLSMIWATLWLYCFPHLWTLLPWGSWDTNWWKVFPFIFGLSWLGLGPLIGTISTILGEFKEFAETEKQALDFEDDFKTKLSKSSDEGKNFRFQEKKPQDPILQPLTKENDGDTKVIQTQFTSILGDMNIHEKYKK